jgi:hypothetical protein
MQTLIMEGLSWVGDADAGPDEDATIEYVLLAYYSPPCN